MSLSFLVSSVFSFDASKSTKGASKLRRDLINSEIANLRDLLPLPSSTRQRLSQLQLMALVCVYVRKANYFHHGECSPFHTSRHNASASFEQNSDLTVAFNDHDERGMSARRKISRSLADARARTPIPDQGCICCQV
jgi:hypothetical protein